MLAGPGGRVFPSSSDGTPSVSMMMLLVWQDQHTASWFAEEADSAPVAVLSHEAPNRGSVGVW